MWLLRHVQYDELPLPKHSWRDIVMYFWSGVLQALSSYDPLKAVGCDMTGT